MAVSPGRVLLAAGGSRESDAAPLVAMTLAASTDSALHVVHVGRGHPPWFERHEGLVEWLRQEAQGCLDQQVAKIEDAGGIVARTHLRMSGRPADAILEVSEEIGAGFIVLGGRRRGKLRRALTGGVSDRVVRNARCPVLIVRGARNGRR
ncbi:universal stress protein [Rubrobacter tropicus]|uniref:Universal stress protein n=2 Tax=Rubrobacter tropicus TaxID=2653851 RepID=A0A6G8QFV2_9ACTN|nr:universal stress protein [Rubrobacter tropicus]